MERGYIVKTKLQRSRAPELKWPECKIESYITHEEQEEENRMEEKGEVEKRV